MSLVVLCDDAADDLRARLRAAFPGYAVCLISDDRVAELHARALAASIASAHPRSTLLTFPPGEASKNRTSWARLTDAMIAHGYGRDTVVVAVGGGVTGDLAGFVAATYMRGVPVLHVPTSLVAMVDAAIGGKTALDVPGGKNLVGAFHMPDAVLVDPAFLRTLPLAHVKEGLVEALKHGAIVDVDYFEWMRAHVHTLARDGGPAAAADARRLVQRSVEIKTQVVDEDPREQGRRAILNFGHTVGHALEQASGYAVTHGQAVAHGMIVEARIGEALGVTETGTAARLEEAVRALELPPLPRLERSAVLEAAGTDKKNRRGAIRMALLRRIGEVVRAEDGAWTHVVPSDHILLP